jgi:hypothetical protein
MSLFSVDVSFLSLFLLLLVLLFSPSTPGRPQDTWTKAMRPLAKWLMAAGGVVG